MPSDNIYQIDWKKLTRWLMPVVMRKRKMLAFVYALTSGINDLHSRFYAYKQNVDYRLKINYQVCNLERALNDKYDYSQRRIRIERAKQYNPLPLFRKEESKPVKLLKKGEGAGQVLYTKSETAQFTVDFIIKIPVTVAFDQTALRAFVDSQIVQSRTYKISLV